MHLKIRQSIPHVTFVGVKLMANGLPELIVFVGAAGIRVIGCIKVFCPVVLAEP